MTRVLILSIFWIMMWALQIAIKLPTAILGLVMVPLTYRYKNTPLKDCPKLLLPWLNPEDWEGGSPGYPDSIPPFWVKRHGVNFKSHFLYHCIRNPADGLRNFKWLQVVPDSNKIDFITNQYRENYEPHAEPVPKFSYYVCWQGIYCGILIQYVWSDSKYLEFRFGFRIYPRLKFKPLPATDFKMILGASMATKFLPYRDY